MLSTFRTAVSIAFFTVLLSNSANAQKELINVSVGLGVSIPDDTTDAISYGGSGFYTQGEYVFNFSKWFALRPYAGLILTSPDKSTDETKPNEYKVTTNAFLLGGKARLTFPIPYVAPFFELGVGVSIGSFVTYTPLTDLKTNGLVTHTPLGFGLALGRKHNFEIAYVYYNHDSVKQVCGAMAIGYSIPLN